LDGTYEIAEFKLPYAGKSTLHADVTAAKNTIFNVRTLEKEHGVRVVLAHDVSWMRNEDKALLSLLNEQMASARERILHGGIP
jgi:hypothetical protein